MVRQPWSFGVTHENLVVLEDSTTMSIIELDSILCPKRPLEIRLIEKPLLVINV
jgi:hypothetical protein